MNKIAKVAVIVGVIGAICGGSAWAGTITDRQRVQNHRIVQGIRSGALTPVEVRALYRQQHRIQRFRARAWSDGWLSIRERATLRHHQDMASRRIHRLKHNHHVRW